MLSNVLALKEVCLEPPEFIGVLADFFLLCDFLLSTSKCFYHVIFVRFKINLVIIITWDGVGIQGFSTKTDVSSDKPQTPGNIRVPEILTTV